MPLEEALDTYGEWARQPTAAIRAATGGDDSGARARARENERALAKLKAMMGGTR